ncbi:hypothetical protein IHE49_01595 [Rhodanobacter sp. 7MK24]|uniref:hypothetical protein n=1 Tax=Rhodanobacter sp. 7MK24 TaxID=2775922 RepID=UPI001783C1F9|nr:hypothetical protein [Rhodanobacter sp. 7MK24]MBD8879170.1 hypothetical protein [Rhodanobacter sp. 7MK24]
MSHLIRLFAVALFVPVLAAAASTQATPLTVRSQAELNRYLRDIPIANTPLAPLSSGGRKRFLGELIWGRRGLGGVPLDDIDNELTHEQAVRLLSLFDVQAYARGHGLTLVERARRQAERTEDAKARGCAVDNCPESAIEQRFDALMLREPDPVLPDVERRAGIGRHYTDLFSHLQRPDSLRGASKPDLRLLKRAAEYALSTQPSAGNISDLQADLAELQHRGMVDDRDYTGLYAAFVTTRQLGKASMLAQGHPGISVDAIPAVSSTTLLPPGQPTALLVDARLRPLFAKHAIWLASQSTPFADAAEWNRLFPDQPIHIAWQDNEWSMLDDWSMPTFYVFRQGRLADKWSGHDMELLRTHLRKDGLLQ